MVVRALNFERNQKTRLAERQQKSWQMRGTKKRYAWQKHKQRGEKRGRSIGEDVAGAWQKHKQRGGRSVAEA